jgi:hypothetical protein
MQHFDIKRASWAALCFVLLIRLTIYPAAGNDIQNTKYPAVKSFEYWWHKPDRFLCSFVLLNPHAAENDIQKGPTVNFFPPRQF